MLQLVNVHEMQVKKIPVRLLKFQDADKEPACI